MYTIMGRYLNHEAEEIDTADTREEAEYLLGEYRLAFGGDFQLWIV